MRAFHTRVKKFVRVEPASQLAPVTVCFVSGCRTKLQPFLRGAKPITVDLYRDGIMQCLEKAAIGCVVVGS